MFQLRNNDLFLLIKSMSPAEKRDFRWYAGRRNKKGKNQYLLLFESVCAEVNRLAKNKRRAPKSAGNKGTGNPPKSRMAKKYLYRMILRSLEIQHAEDSVNAKLLKFNHQIEILFYKRLFHPCRVLIRRAKHLAYQYERYEALMGIIKSEQIVLNENAEDEKNRRELKKCFEEEKRIVDIQRTLNELSYLGFQLVSITATYHFIRTGEERKIHDRIMSHALLKEEPAFDSYILKYVFYVCHLRYLSATGDSEGAYRCSAKMMSHLETRQDRILNEPLRYLSSGMEHMRLATYAGCFRVTLAWSKKIISKVNLLLSKTDHKNFADRFILSCYISQLDIYSLQAEQIKGQETVRQIELLLKTSFFLPPAHKINPALTISNFFFLFGEYSSCARWINFVLNNPDITISNIDQQISARTLFLLCHYEMKDTEILESAVRSFYRLLLKKKMKLKTETVILDFIRKVVMRRMPGEDMTPHFRILKDKLEFLMRDPMEKQHMFDFDYLSWLESKITGKPFAEILRGNQKS